VERTPSVKRVVLTSSVVALYGAPDERGAAHAFDENDWAIVPKTNVLPYFYSKKVAEQRAWELHAKQSRSVPWAVPCFPCLSSCPASFSSGWCLQSSIFRPAHTKWWAAAQQEAFKARALTMPA
jgi:hypothetical protein